MKKLTAANSHLLAWTKRVYNDKIFSATSKILNESGLDAAIEHLLQYVRPATRPHRKGFLYDVASGATQQVEV